jgi:hypothetical protein
MAGRLVFDRPESPYRQLLARAGCELGDLRATAAAHGVERALELLRDAGVYVTLDELRGRTPIVRDGLEIETRPGSFDNPLLLGRSVRGHTSGTSSAPRRVLLDWVGLAEEAEENLVLYETHGLLGRPLALWLAPPPGVAGLNALLVNAKRGHPPERWFSPVSSRFPGTPPSAQLAPHVLGLIGRAAGLRLPRPRRVPIENAGVVARWLADHIAHDTPGIVRTSASGGVRVAEAALRDGVSIAGSVALVAGEPLTAARRRGMEAAELAPIPHYGAAEIGLIAGGCAEPLDDDDMHVYLDRLAITVLERRFSAAGPALNSLLVTSLSLATGRVMLNAELGDHAHVERRPCGCLLGELGFDLHLARVRSHDKLTGEGMALLGGELDDAVGACVERAGGGPNDYQFWERRDEGGATKLVLAVAPELAIDERAFLDAVLDELRVRAPAGPLAAEVWGKARTLEVVRVRPQPTKALKLRPLERR